MENTREQESLKDIEGLIQIYSEELTTEKEQFGILKEEHITVVSNWRQYILAAVTFAAPLIVSLAGTEPIKSHLVLILEIIIAFGLGSFFLLTAIRSTASTVLRKIDNEYLKLISNLYYVKAYVADTSLGHNYDRQLIEFLRAYASIVYANRVGLWYAFNQASNSIILWQIRDTLIQSASSQIEIIYTAAQALRKLKIQLPENHRLRRMTKSLQVISNPLENMEKEPNINPKDLLTRLETLLLEANIRKSQ
jgi:hypothetical protein